MADRQRRITAWDGGGGSQHSNEVSLGKNACTVITLNRLNMHRYAALSIFAGHLLDEAMDANWTELLAFGISPVWQSHHDCSCRCGLRCLPSRMILALKQGKHREYRYKNRSKNYKSRDVQHSVRSQTEITPKRQPHGH